MVGLQVSIGFHTANQPFRLPASRLHRHDAAQPFESQRISSIARTSGLFLDLCMVFAYVPVMQTVQMTDNQTRTFIWYHVPMLLWASAIITVSSIPDLKSPDLAIPSFDKLAHFIEYSVLAALTFRSFARLAPGVSVNAAFGLALSFIAVFAALDEYYQGYVPGRVPDLYDFMSDFTAAILVITFSWVRVRGVASRKRG